MSKSQKSAAESGEEKKDAAEGGETSKPEETKKSPSKAAAKSTAPFVVAKGKSVTTRRGIRGEGESVEAADFDVVDKKSGDKLRDGAESLKHLVSKGVVVKS